MHGLVREIEKEGFALIATVLEPAQGIVGQLIRDVAFLLDRLAVNVELLPLTTGHLLRSQAIGRKVLTLPPKADPIIETRTRRVRCLAHMPLADERGLIARA